MTTTEELTGHQLLALGAEGRREHLARYWGKLSGRLDFDYLDTLVAWVATDSGLTYDQAEERALSDIDTIRNAEGTTR